MKRCPTCQTAYPSDYALCPRDGSALIEVGEWAEGSVVRGKYRILAKVGQGGMGAVYKAIHTRFKEVRALKVISPELASDAHFVRRFEQEAIIARKLQHAMPCELRTSTKRRMAARSSSWSTSRAAAWRT